MSKKKIAVSVGTNFQSPDNNSDVDEVLKKNGLKRSDLWRLSYDDEIYTCIQNREQAVIGTYWNLEGQAPEWLYDAIAKIYEPAIRAIMRAKWLGKSIAEIVYYQQEALYLISEIIIRKIEDFQEEDGAIFWQNPYGEKVLTSKYKILNSGVNVSESNPFGDSLLSRVYYPWFLRSYGFQYWSKFVERHASPLTVVKSEISALDAEEATNQLADLAAAISNAVGAGTIALSESDNLDFLETSNNGEAQALFIRMQNQRIQKVLLGRVLNSELANSSRAAQETDDNFYQRIYESDLNFCEKGLNFLVRCLLELNGVTTEWVYFSYSRKNTIDKERWERDVALLNSGKINFTKQYFRDFYGLEEQYFTLAENNFSTAQVSLSAPKLSFGAQILENQIINNLANSPDDKNSAQILQLAQQSRDESAFLAELRASYRRGDLSDFAYENWLGKSLAGASAQGYLQAEKGIY